MWAAAPPLRPLLRRRAMPIRRVSLEESESAVAEIEGRGGTVTALAVTPGGAVLITYTDKRRKAPGQKETR
jgi:hypothetical protein